MVSDANLSSIWQTSWFDSLSLTNVCRLNQWQFYPLIYVLLKLFLFIDYKWYLANDDWFSWYPHLIDQWQGCCWNWCFDNELFTISCQKTMLFTWFRGILRNWIIFGGSLLSVEEHLRRLKTSFQNCLWQLFGYDWIA